MADQGRLRLVAGACVCRDLGVEVKVIHNASVMNAVGACGLQLYRFGQTVSIVFFTDTWR
jgi:diphthine synthase